MKNSYLGQPKGRGYKPDNDWEVAEEISPDPFSEEEHTRIHAGRFKSPKKYGNSKNEENKSNIEQS
ncbi:MAG: hypothetical protein PHR14_04060 [Oscillospiraceae bacterium]|nr:hypothetical protein [Oscillospiraceae bacterium]